FIVDLILLKLPAETLQLPLQLVDLVLERRDAAFQSQSRRARFRLVFSLVMRRSAVPKMPPAAAAGGSGERIGLARGEGFQHAFDLFHILKRVHALGAPAQFADGLR